MEEENKNNGLSPIEQEILIEQVRKEMPLLQQVAKEISKVIETYYISFKESPSIEDKDVPAMAVHAAIYHALK
ncbi:hypothetical protein [Listeria booriae]|uniref:hypothetical protein n=1 Tax=Listeria booriae TaxID=1552123 RepID=UPI00163DC9EE|nr:hypothetical protein [Listeria booriae]MBC1307913.1 hypothetical protein [Listeria booriae]